MLNWDNWGLPHSLYSDSGLLLLRPHTHTDTKLKLLPAKACLHSRKMKLCYLHSESVSGMSLPSVCALNPHLFFLMITDRGCLLKRAIITVRYDEELSCQVSASEICFWISRSSAWSDLSHGLTARQPVGQVRLGVAASLVLPKRRLHVMVCFMIFLDSINLK